MQLSVKHPRHTDAAGNPVHGSHILSQDVQHNHAPSMSYKMKEWIRSQLLDGQTTQQIMAKHAKSALPQIESGKADRDCYLDAQDICNIALSQAKLTWKLHVNEAQSVRLFYQEHSDHVFIYQEECSQPQQSATQQSAVNNSQLANSTGSESAQSQVSLRFVFGWMTEAMLANMLKYGNNNLILLDATFGTNHMKMPLYTGLVMDAFGNGLPAFMV
ncbi:hypothetical protein ABBQ32_004035 [Trebouxia sp. C0010 RCD-2024]